MICDPKMLEGDLFLFKQTSDECMTVSWTDEGIVATEFDGEVYHELDLSSEFYRTIFDSDELKNFFKTFPTAILFGMWEDKMFKVTDVTAPHPEDEDDMIVQNFEYYQPVLEHFKINYRAPVVKFINPKDETYIERVMDVGIWHLKNYGLQVTETIYVRERLSEEGNSAS